MATITKNETPKESVPAVSGWRDSYYTKSPHEKIMVWGGARAFNTLLALAYWIAIISIYETTIGPQVVLSGLIVTSIIHFFVSAFFITAAQSGDYRTIRLWFILDITLSAIYVVLIIVLLCITPSNRFILVVGIKLMILSIYLNLKMSAKYVKFLNQPNQPQVFTNNVP